MQQCVGPRPFAFKACHHAVTAESSVTSRSQPAFVISSLVLVAKFPMTRKRETRNENFLVCGFSFRFTGNRFEKRETKRDHKLRPSIACDTRGDAPAQLLNISLSFEHVTGCYNAHRFSPGPRHLLTGWRTPTKQSASRGTPTDAPPERYPCSGSAPASEATTPHVVLGMSFPQKSPSEMTEKSLRNSENEINRRWSPYYSPTFQSVVKLPIAKRRDRPPKIILFKF